MNLLILFLLFGFFLGVLLTYFCCKVKLDEQNREISLNKTKIKGRDDVIKTQSEKIEKYKAETEMLKDIKIVISNKGTIVDKYDLIKELAEKYD